MKTKLIICRYLKTISLIILVLFMMNCNKKTLQIDIYETSEAGHSFKKIEVNSKASDGLLLTINPTEEFQTITGIGGSFTESTAHVLKQLSAANRQKVLEAYFGETGARYSLTRTHMASCDFSLSNYTYAKKENDTLLSSFSIADDLADLIPLILDAKKISKDGFNIIASPWTAPPWMKDNKNWVGGKLLPEFYPAFALYFEKYLEAYKAQNIDIWAITVINEPHGNGDNWESTHFSPKEMTDFVKNHLGPQLDNEKWKHINILGYDQNRAGLNEWVDVMYENEATSKYYAGTAIHWYESTYDYFPKALQYAHHKAPNKYLIQTEGCVDSEIPVWQDDQWYWQKNATDWGWDWASEADKHLHPKYAPVHRYATDLIGCLNNWVDGWVDWNMVLDRQGGPNWFKNWCVAPVIVDTENDEVYFTPLFDVMKHFSRFIRPGAIKIGCTHNHQNIMSTVVKNLDGSIVIVLFNPTEKSENITLNIINQKQYLTIDKQAIQTLVIQSNN